MSHANEAAARNATALVTAAVLRMKENGMTEDQIRPLLPEMAAAAVRFLAAKMAS